MIDPSDIKAGAQFVVTIAPVHYGDRDYAPIANLENELEHTSVPIAYLSPLPAPSPTAEIDAEIVEAADKWMAEYRTTNIQPHDFYPLLFQSLINRRRALLKPKDAVGELLEAVAGLIAKIGHAKMREVEAFLGAAARVRKERGE